MALTFRPAKYSDLELTYLLKKDGLKNYVEKIWGWEEENQKELHEKTFDPKNTEIIQFDNNEIGYLTKRVSDSEIYIENLILGEKFQNNGLGTKIVSSIIQKAER